jgi:predicted nucleic-acid-binding protein
MMQYIVDSNFILRYLLNDNPEQYKQAKLIFDEARSGKVQICLEQVVFVEVIFVLTSFYKVLKEKIVEIMHSLLSYKGINTEKELLSAALDLYKTHNIHIVDSIIAAKAKL